MLVCRSWWSVLDTSSLLFYKVEIDSSLKQFKKFMEMIKQSPRRAAQVEELKIYCSDTRTFDPRILFNIFPSIHSMSLPRNPNFEFSFFAFTGPIGAPQTESRVQHIFDHLFCRYTLHMVALHLCNQLETLDMEFYTSRRMSPLVIIKLENMSVLRELSLRSPILDIDSMELLHDNLPSLQIINLVDEELGYSEVPNKILPTIFLKKIKIFIIVAEDPDDCRDHWYRYVSSKYINVTKCGMYDEIPCEVGDRTSP